MTKEEQAAFFKAALYKSKYTDIQGFLDDDCDVLQLIVEAHVALLAAEELRQAKATITRLALEALHPFGCECISCTSPLINHE